MARVGLTMGGGRGGASEAIHQVQRAEELGYDSLWAGESWGRDSVSTLTQIACNTKKIKLAFGILNVFSRTPGTMAQTIATMDEISGGRMILGLGASGNLVIENWHGMKFEKPIQRTREYIQIIRLALSGERVNYDGQLFHLKNFRLPFEAVRKRVPIYVASIGPKNLELTGELADGCQSIHFSIRNAGYFKGELTTGAKKAGRKLEDIDLAAQQVACVSPDRQEARNLARAHIAFYIGGMGLFYHQLMLRYGYVEEANTVQALYAQRDSKGAAARVTDAMVDDLSISGTPRECKERMEALRASGVTLPIVSFAQGSTPQMVRDTLEALAPGR